MKLEIISHCFNYSRLLSLQVFSLISFPPAPSKLSILHTVFYSREDADTVAALAKFTAPHAAEHWPPNVKWRHWPLETPELCRRAIGRNLAARETLADWAWFADCDYLFGPGCLDVLPEQLAKIAGPLAYPRYAIRSPNDAAGDAFIESVNVSNIYPSCITDHFRGGSVETIRRAIGGVQIVRGDVAREKGYLPDSRKWQRPADRWMRTYEDRAFRGALGTHGEPIELPNLFRVRHSKRGRFDVGCKN